MSWIEERCFPEKKFYKDANQTKKFIEAKTENDIYYRGANTINPLFYQTLQIQSDSLSPTNYKLVYEFFFGLS